MPVKRVHAKSNRMRPFRFHLDWSVLNIFLSLKTFFFFVNNALIPCNFVWTRCLVFSYSTSTTFYRFRSRWILENPFSVSRTVVPRVRRFFLLLPPLTFLTPPPSGIEFSNILSRRMPTGVRWSELCVDRSVKSGHPFIGFTVHGYCCLQSERDCLLLSVQQYACSGRGSQERNARRDRSVFRYGRRDGYRRRERNANNIRITARASGNSRSKRQVDE